MVAELEPFPPIVSSVRRNKDYSVIQNAKAVLQGWHLYVGRIVPPVTETMELIAQSRVRMGEGRAIRGFLEIRWMIPVCLIDANATMAQATAKKLELLCIRNARRVFML